ncbi:hypothetical protein [Novosphingobium sp.]|uniref:hypothetical protein n=1 Tax=Novosphingobium sp. TaxID=1874826 RepID=UPI0025DCAB0C|nr:hypothetical protein [Novosphingobium sp.]MCC6925792.1 hypothetical protein [Novosphingobium sp.]
MRRAAPTLAISPKLLKHFAAVTVVLTILLAIFASDEDWGAEAQLEAAQAKNQLIAKEAEKFGAKKLASSLKVREADRGTGFGSDEGGEGGGGGGWKRSARPAPEVSGPRQGPRGVPQLEQRAGATLTVRGMDIEDVVPEQRGKSKKKKAYSDEVFMPDATQIEAIKQRSRQRTGGSSSAVE